MTGNLSGRPPAKIITDHFKQLEKLENRSNRRYYECKYCGPNGAGNRIEGRDNKPLKHILACSQAPHPVTTQQCPLKTMAVVLHSVVPHAADVERYFSGLGGTQSVKRCNLTVETFEGLSKLRSSYAHHLYKIDRAAGKSVHRKHAHMHTQTKPGIDASLAEDLTKNFTWVPPLITQSEPEDDYLAGPEAITDEELSSAFDALDHEKQDTSVLATNSYLGAQVDPELELDGNEVLEGQVYSWKELEVVDKGSLPMGFAEDISVLDKAGDGQWDIQALLSSEGVAF